MKILVYGAGAVGGYIGSLLWQQKHEVTLVARKVTGALIQQHGLTISEEGQTITVHPPAVPSVAAAFMDNPHYDLIIMGMKAYDVETALDPLIAVNNVSLEIEPGEFLCFLGPSGCGKTTILRMITGFEEVTTGNIIYDGKVINDVIPQKREFGIVFQSYALFPNMTVSQNIAFGLKMRMLQHFLF